MSQLSYAQSHNRAFQGMKADMMFDYVESKAAQGSFGFGSAVVKGDAQADTARPPRRQTATVIFSADLVTSNVINGTVNGVALTATTFATDHATTMAAIATKIDALLLTLGIVAVSTVGGASNRTITTVAKDANVLFASFVVTAGGSQATVTHTYTDAGFFRGVALHTHKAIRADGTPGYEDGDAVSILRRGRVWVVVREAVLENDDAYAVLANAGDEEKFGKTSTGNIATGGKFRTAQATAGQLALLEINLP